MYIVLMREMQMKLRMKLELEPRLLILDTRGCFFSPDEAEELGIEGEMSGYVEFVTEGLAPFPSRRADDTALVERTNVAGGTGDCGFPNSRLTKRGLQFPAGEWIQRLARPNA